MKIEMAGNYRIYRPQANIGNFFLVLRGSQTNHLPPRKFVAPQRLFRSARLTNPAIKVIKCT